MKEVNSVHPAMTNNGRKFHSKADSMAHSQGRTFGPLLGLFLLSVLAKAIDAKYLSYDPHNLHYSINPWMAYNNPKPIYEYPKYPQWYPIEDPYNYGPPIYQSYPTLTTEIPYVENDHYAFKRNYVVNDNKLPIANIENSNNIDELVAAESNVNVRRKAPQKYRKSSNRYQQRRRRTTTTVPPEYYDSYEDFTTERYTRTTPYSQQTTEAYDDEYYDSVETTTKYYKKQKRRPTKNKNKRRNPVTTQSSVEYDSDESAEKPVTEILIVRQALPTTTTEPTTLITNSTTTEESSTISTTTTEETSTNGTFYGYGPSNGNEGISFTYGPPTNGNYQFAVPHYEWYSNEATRNAVIKRVGDIVSFDNRFT